MSAKHFWRTMTSPAPLVVCHSGESCATPSGAPHIKLPTQSSTSSLAFSYLKLLRYNCFFSSLYFNLVIFLICLFLCWLVKKIGKSIKTYPRFPVAYKMAIWNRSHVSITRYMAEIFPTRRETLYNKSIPVICAVLIDEQRFSF